MINIDLQNSTDILVAHFVSSLPNLDKSPINYCPIYFIKNNFGVIAFNHVACRLFKIGPSGCCTFFRLLSLNCSCDDGDNSANASAVKSIFDVKLIKTLINVYKKDRNVINLNNMFFIIKACDIDKYLAVRLICDTIKLQTYHNSEICVNRLISKHERSKDHARKLCSELLDEEIKMYVKPIFPKALGYLLDILQRIIDDDSEQVDEKEINSNVGRGGSLLSTIKSWIPYFGNAIKADNHLSDFDKCFYEQFNFLKEDGQLLEDDEQIQQREYFKLGKVFRTTYLVEWNYRFRLLCIMSHFADVYLISRDELKHSIKFYKMRYDYLSKINVWCIRFTLSTN